MGTIFSSLASKPLEVPRGYEPLLSGSEAGSGSYREPSDEAEYPLEIPNVDCFEEGDNDPIAAFSELAPTYSLLCTIRSATCDMLQWQMHPPSNTVNFSAVRC